VLRISTFSGVKIRFKVRMRVRVKFRVWVRSGVEVRA
jgi:hypothetical protein